ncbi:HET-domain-containing protein [Xylaria telfairii]|nr:HET-domain-containing protein [Xylaria telfairii]
MGSLCDICRTIPFREIQEDPSRKLDRVKLGDYDAVKQRVSCAFCCLALRSIWDVAQRLGYSDTGEYLVKECLRTPIAVQWRHQDHTFEAGGSPLRYTSGNFPSLARIVHPVPVRIDPIISLLEDCEASHQCSLPVSEENSDKALSLRAINVRNLCIVPITLSMRYVALSYVWGGTPVPNLIRANKEEFMKPGALEAYQDKIPATIRDAIELVRRMGLEYLWVDAMCLVQDDIEEKVVGINAMSMIYEHSYFTVIAADGSNADAGLPGVSTRTVNQVTAEILPGVNLVMVHNIGSMLEIAYYNKRAWTFQEFHLSRRKLIFHNNMVYYQCIEGSWSEDIEGVSIDSRIRNRALVPTRVDKMFFDFMLIIGEYAVRDATYQHDIVNAMTSVYHRLLGKEYGDHLFGVPIVVFDMFMCFYSKDTHLQFLKRRHGLPSWVWSGWRGDFEWACDSDDNKALLWAANCTWIIWYMTDSAGNLSLIWELPRRNNNSSTSIESLRINRVAAAQRFSTDPLPTVPLRKVPVTLERPIGLLRFWTLSAYFSLRVDTAGERYLGSMDFMDWKVAQEVFGPEGKYYGFIQVDEESSKYDQDVVELIVISEAAEVVSRDHHAFYRNKHWAQLIKQDYGHWYNVLYVEETLGIAERKGFGQIRCDTIVLSPESPWKWKEIILG